MTFSTLIAWLQRLWTVPGPHVARLLPAVEPRADREPAPGGHPLAGVSPGGPEDADAALRDLHRLDAHLLQDLGFRDARPGR